MRLHFVKKSNLGQAHLIFLIACSKGKSHGKMYHMGTHIYSVENIFEAEQHLTKWTSDFNIPYKSKVLNCQLGSRWITLTFLRIVRLVQTFLLSLLFLTVLPSSIWVNHCTTEHLSSDYSQSNHRQF